ncbi:serine/threonine-protein kinase, partial [Planctomycetota bacterium]
MSWKSAEHDGIFVSDIEAGIPPYVSNGFEKYSHPRHLARGGKADVRIYKDTNLGRNVVVKLLRPDVRGDQQELRRLLREARITAQLQHPGTVPVYEIGQDDKGNFYFTMKKVAGETLFEIIRNLAKQKAEYEERYSLDRLLNVFTQISDTLGYAHTRGVIHRDVKPENILIGRFGEAMLLDWGVAKDVTIAIRGIGDGKSFR